MYHETRLSRNGPEKKYLEQRGSLKGGTGGRQRVSEWGERMCRQWGERVCREWWKRVCREWGERECRECGERVTEKSSSSVPMAREATNGEVGGRALTPGTCGVRGRVSGV